MENLKTSTSELDLLKETISKPPPTDVEIVEDVIENSDVSKEVKDAVKDAYSAINIDKDGKIENSEEREIEVNTEAETLLNLNLSTSVIIADNFYKEPDLIREFALEQTYDDVSDWYGGKRTNHNDDKFKESNGFLHYSIEQLIGKEIVDWNEFDVNTQFQLLSAKVPSYLIFHGSQVWCGLVCLTPNAPAASGLALYKSKITGMRIHSDAERNEMGYEETINTTFAYGYYDKTKFDEVDKIGNIYNRLLLWKAENLHSITEYFGDEKYNSSLFQLFVFKVQ